MKTLWVDFNRMTPSGYLTTLIPDWFHDSGIKTPDEITVTDGVDTAKATVLGFGTRVIELRVHLS